MSTHRRLLYALLVTLAAFGSTELVLRLAGVAEQDQLLSPLFFQQSDSPPGALPRQGDWVQWEDGTLYRPRLDGYRVLALGGSATLGDQVTPFGDFSHQLQRLLVRALPDTPVEVVNLGRGGAGSRQVMRTLMQGLVSLQPQVAVIYSGNNEFHELRALASASPAYRANLERLRRRMHGLRTYRLLQHALGRDRLEPLQVEGVRHQPVTELPALSGPEDRALARWLYRENLERMIALGRDAGVPIVLTTVADNRADWSDSSSPALLTEDERAFLDRVEALRLRRDRAGLEAAAADGWDRLHDERTFYAVGRALMELGAPEPARRYLEQAELVAARPNRANTELRAVARAVAQEQRVPLCDLADALDRHSAGGVAGDALFADACHPNAAGHALIARQLAGCLAEHDLLPGPVASNAWTPPLPVDPLRLDHDARRNGDPFAPDTTTDPGVLADARAGHTAFEQRRYDEAWERYEQALAAGGAPAALLASQALVRWQQGRMDAASALLARARAAGPDDPELHNWAALFAR